MPCVDMSPIVLPISWEKSKLNKKANWSAQSQLTSEMMRYGSTISSGSQVGYKTPTVASGTFDLEPHMLFSVPLVGHSARESSVLPVHGPITLTVASEELRDMHRRDYLIKWESYTSRLD
jgi:hypothetical protein